jgi:hypothetical protein
MFGKETLYYSVPTEPSRTVSVSPGVLFAHLVPAGRERATPSVSQAMFALGGWSVSAKEESATPALLLGDGSKRSSGVENSQRRRLAHPATPSDHADDDVESLATL